MAHSRGAPPHGREAVSESTTPGEKVVTGAVIGIVGILWLIVIPALPIIFCVWLIRSCT